MSKVVVLGGGMVGRVMALDLARDDGIEVTVADRDEKVLAALPENLSGVRADLSDPEKVKALVSDFDLVVGAVPGFLGFQTLRAVIEAGMDYADISFMPQDYLELDGLAKGRGVTAVVDCGVAPGMSNMIVGRMRAEFDSLQEVVIYVGGLQKKREWPWEYKAPFSPIDVIEEYTRPARFIRGGEVVTMEALTEPEIIELPGVGQLEAFNTDGLRSIMNTVRAENMIEKTLRYPGHIDKIRVLRDSGFFSEEPRDVGGQTVRPIDLATSLLFPMWKLGPGIEEFTVMRVQVEGEKAGRFQKRTYDLLDRTDMESGFSSMSRTTGFPNAIVARMLLDGRFKRPGVNPPEFIGEREGLFSEVMAGLRERGVEFSVASD